MRVRGRWGEELRAENCIVTVPLVRKIASKGTSLCFRSVCIVWRSELFLPADGYCGCGSIEISQVDVKKRTFVPLHMYM